MTHAYAFVGSYCSASPRLILPRAEVGYAFSELKARWLRKCWEPVFGSSVRATSCTRSRSSLRFSSWSLNPPRPYTILSVSKLGHIFFVKAFHDKLFVTDRCTRILSVYLSRKAMSESRWARRHGAISEGLVRPLQP